MAELKTYSVRVRIREITFSRKGTNILGQDVVESQTAYGPGRPEIDPVRLLGADADPESDEYKTAVTNFQLGERVELLDQDYLRLINGKAVVDAEAAEAAAAEAANAETLDVGTAAIEDLANWIKEEQPNAQTVVNASDGSPDLARKLIEAESLARDGEPRKTVLDGLSAVIARG